MRVDEPQDEPEKPRGERAERGIVRALLATTGPAPGQLEHLHARLEAAAGDEGVLEVAYTTVDSPLGSLLVAATEQGLVRLAFAGEGFDRVLEALATRISPRVLRAPGRLERAARELDEYFAGRRTGFDLPLDRCLSGGFRRAVQAVLPGIPYGETRSYKEVASTVGSPGAVRAVGTACATNPLPILVPCHRVLRSDGSIGDYRGGAAAKAALLELERPT